jgi:hypothetical protein
MEEIVSAKFRNAQRCAQRIALLVTVGSERLMICIPERAAPMRGFRYSKYTCP